MKRPAPGGALNSRIIFRYIVPNVVGTILIQDTMQVSQNILMGATLSFVGLGVQPPAPEWGSMLSDGLKDMVKLIPQEEKELRERNLALVRQYMNYAGYERQNRVELYTDDHRDGLYCWETGILPKVVPGKARKASFDRKNVRFFRTGRMQKRNCTKRLTRMCILQPTEALEIL